jgi:hydroxyacylglutathione hydrolase
MKLSLFTATLLALATTLCHAQIPEPDGGPIRAGTLPLVWQTGGPKCMEVPEWQIHEYNPDLFILRQSGCTDYEKPFIFLFFGKEKALLLDTGSRNGNLVPTLQRTVHNWLIRNNRASIPLIVVHTHPHSDHTAGDAEVQALKDPAMPVTFVPPTVEATKTFYHMEHWPEDIGQVDLGDRVIDVLGIPGHSAVSVALYDRQTAILFSGDSLYPGRLYVADFDAFQASTERMIKFTEGKLVSHIIGNHIEQTRTAYLDYPVGTMYQPNEHVLEMTRGDLLELEVGLLSLHGKPARLALADMTIWPVPVSGIMRLETKEHFDARQKEQKARMWDQTAAH